MSAMPRGRTVCFAHQPFSHIPKTIPGRLLAPYSPKKNCWNFIGKERDKAKDATLKKNTKGRFGKEQGWHPETNITYGLGRN